MENIPRPGEFYRHFKNRMYQVLAIATHSETGERMVVYQALYGDFSVYVRPLGMFMEPVDREKYPEVRQRDRFEKVSPKDDYKAGRDAGEDNGRIEDSKDGSDSDRSVCGGTGISPLLLKFLDADNSEERVNILQSMKGKVEQQELDSLYVALDAKVCDGTVDEQLEKLKQDLNMQQRFDAPRLRRG